MPTPTATIRFSDGTDIDLDQSVVIGRSPSSDPSVTDGSSQAIERIDDPQMSRAHARVDLGTTDATLVDLASGNGTVVERSGETHQLVANEPFALRPGDVIRFGQTTAHFESTYYQANNATQIVTPQSTAPVDTTHPPAAAATQIVSPQPTPGTQPPAPAADPAAALGAATAGAPAAAAGAGAGAGAAPSAPFAPSSPGSTAPSSSPSSPVSESAPTPSSPFADNSPRPSRPSSSPFADSSPSPTPPVSSPFPSSPAPARAGSGTGQTVQLASFGNRLGGWFLDALLYGLAFIGVIMAAIIAGFLHAALGILVGLLGYIAVVVLYFRALGTTGQTWGRTLAGIKVVDERSGTPIGIGRGILRSLVESIASGFLFLGYLWMLWDDKKQTWHDKVANSVVIKV